MIGVDTNILVRYITKDDTRQFNRVQHLLLVDCSRMTPGYVNSVVLCELVWVLRTKHGADRESIASVLDQLLLSEQLEIERRELVFAAVKQFKASKVDFADCLIGILNQKAGCSRTATLDKAASKLATFELLR